MRSAAIMVFVIASAVFVTPAATQQAATVTPPPMTASQRESLAKLQADEQVYEEFRYWASFQPPELEDLLKPYDGVLAQRGVPPAERARVLKTIEEQGRRLEVERWNRILTADKPAFNTTPMRSWLRLSRGVVRVVLWTSAWDREETRCTLPNRVGMSLASILRSLSFATKTGRPRRTLAREGSSTGSCVWPRRNPDFPISFCASRYCLC